MTASSDPGKFLASGGSRLIVAIVAIGSTVFVAWLFLGGATLRGDVSVIKAELRAANSLALVVASCNGDPEVSLLVETELEVQIEVVASSAPFRGADDCLDVVEVRLQEPLGDRTVVDMHSDQLVAVSRVNPPSD